MINIYDRIVDKDQYEFVYLDSEYYQTGRNSMNKVEYFSYSRAGSEPLLVVPTYAKQFEEAAKKFWKIRKAHSHVAALTRIRELYKQEPQVEVMDYGNEEVVYYYIVDYKFIQIQMRLEKGTLILDPTFTIMKGNVLGNHRTVSVVNNPDLNKYCGEE